MLEFIIGNLSTILVAFIVLGCALLAVRSIRKDKKNGKACGGCSGGCSGCAGSAICHTKQK